MFTCLIITVDDTPQFIEYKNQCIKADQDIGRGWKVLKISSLCAKFQYGMNNTVLHL